MSNRKTTERRTTSTLRAVQRIAGPADSVPLERGRRQAAEAASARDSATTSPIRRWRSAPRPASWQPGAWGDPF